MTDDPTERNQPILRSRLTSPLGEMLVACRGDHLLALDYVDFEGRMNQLLAKGYSGASQMDGDPPACVVSALARYFTGDVTAIDALEVSYAGTPFQNAVWRKLREIPAGQTWSYGQLAASLDNPKAVRAVGRTNGLNPVAIVGPCHRVVGASGSLTGYAGGLDRKRWLLDHEAQQRKLL